MFARIILLCHMLGIFVGGNLNDTCKERHYQYYYCSYPVVLKVIFAGHSNTTAPYRMKVDEIYKNNIPTISRNDYITVEAVPNVSRMLKKIFIVIGRKNGEHIITDECSGVIPWGKLTAYQINGFTDYYNHNCLCISRLPLYSESLKCEFRFANLNNEESASCRWTGGHAFTRCRNRRDQISMYNCTSF